MADRERRKLVMALDPNGGGGLYLDGELVYDFYAEDPYHDMLSDANPTKRAFGGGRNGWAYAMEHLAEMLDIDYDEESRYMLAEKIGGYFEPADYDGYWPKKLEDAPKVKYDENGKLMFGVADEGD